MWLPEASGFRLYEYLSFIECTFPGFVHILKTARRTAVPPIIFWFLWDRCEVIALKENIVSGDFERRYCRSLPLNPI
jgi:hypothetical protein